MTQITAATHTNIFDSFRTTGARARSCKSLQQAAQVAADVLYETFVESMVLVRVFAVVPYRRLPHTDRAFVDMLAVSKGFLGELHDEAPVLSLLGTRGRDAAWNDRKDSKGHLAIPLVSASFIRAVPMLARMLHELGVQLPLEGPSDKTLVAKMLSAGLGGVFHVPDAAVTTDPLGRKVIAAQDFVRAEGVRSVFGVAGNYAGGTSIAVLMFTRDALSRDDATRFLALVNELKASTTSLVSGGRIYP